MRKYLNSKVLVIFTIILFLCLVFLFINTFNFFSVKEVQAFSNLSEISILRNQYPLNIYSILEFNTLDNIKEEMVCEEIDIDYTTKYINNDKLPNGTIHVVQLGDDGKQDIITIKKYNNDILESEKIVASNLKRTSINKIVEIGTGEGINNYELTKGDTVYITTNSLSVMSEASNESEKLTTIFKGDCVIVNEILDNGWSYIEIHNRKGYVLSETLSNINPNEIVIKEKYLDELGKEELLDLLKYNMDLSQPSGFSLKQFRRVLQYNDEDKNNIFTDNCDFFYYAEQEYNINGIFLAAVAIHESGWGTSNIAKEKNNLFGYMAYDSIAFSSAKQFESYSEGIDLLARVFVKYYLNEDGVEVYGGNKAEGKYFSGKTLESVNEHYASDDKWAQAVYNIMEKLYNRL